MMNNENQDLGLEHKFVQLGATSQVANGLLIEGYASLFGEADKGGDIVVKGAYKASLTTLKTKGHRVKMLWQHDPTKPIGIWDEVHEDARGLYVKGRLLTNVEKGREAATLIESGAIDGLSIGYRTVKATKNGKGQRLLSELELWEVSLVTFPMLPSARVGVKAETPDDTALRELAAFLVDARQMLAPGNCASDLNPLNRIV